MTDLATLGLRVESQEVDTADKRLDDFEASAQRAEVATDSLAAAARGLGSSLLPTLGSIDASVRELLELQRAQQGVTSVSQQHVAATQAVKSEAAEAAATIRYYGASFKVAQDSMGGAAAAARSWGAAIGEADAHVVAYRQHMDRVNDTLPQAQRGFRLTAQEGLNFSRQMADIGVTAAMGMNPFMIALQQGPQLFDIMQGAAIRSGITIRAAMVATGAAVWTALAPLLPIIAALAAAAAVSFAAVGLATRAARKEIGDLTEGMGLTEEQMKRLKEQGEDTGVTVGDVFRGTGTTIKETFFDMFGDQIAVIGKIWDDFMDKLWRTIVWVSKAMVGNFLGAFYAIRDTWKMLPAALGDAAITASNLVVEAVEDMINGGVRLLNGLIDKANTAASRLGWSNLIPKLTEAEFNGFANPYQGAMYRTGVQAAQSHARGLEEGAGYVQRAADRLGANIEASGRARIRRAAGDAPETRSGTGGRDREAEQIREVLQDLPRVQIRPIKIDLPEIVDPLQIIADELRLIDQLSQDAANGMASAFGETGRAMGDLLTVMTSYQSRLAEIDLAEREYRLSAAQADRERAAAQVDSYGNMAAAARGFFKEGSDGYNALLAIERVYRIQQLLGAVQAMGIGQQETVMAVANSARRALAYGIEAVANAYRSIPYPFNIAAVAATVAGLAALGIRLAGGGGGGDRGAANDNVAASTEAVQAYSFRDSQARDAAASAIASKVEVRVSADRDGLNAYVVQKAGEVAAPMAARAEASAVRTSSVIARKGAPAVQSSQRRLGTT